MKISEHVYALELPAQMGPNRSILNLALIVDPQQGAMLVDTGIPGMDDAIGEALQEAGLSLSDLRRVVISHQDVDHIGSLAAVVQASGAQVLALAPEVPYIEGSLAPQKSPPPERRAQMIESAGPAMREFFTQRPALKVDRTLQDGELLPFAGGVRVIATPGHTVGHLSLFVEADGVLITADAMTSQDGELRGPNSPFTPDMDEAMRSVRKLAGLPVKTILTYHGGVVDRDAAQQLQRVAEQG